MLCTLLVRGFKVRQLLSVAYPLRLPGQLQLLVTAFPQAQTKETLFSLISTSARLHEQQKQAPRRQNMNATTSCDSPEWSEAQRSSCHLRTQRQFLPFNESLLNWSSCRSRSAQPLDEFDPGVPSNRLCSSA